MGQTVRLTQIPKEAWTVMPRLKKKVVGLPCSDGCGNNSSTPIWAQRQLGQPLVTMSKFPTLLFYKMMGITPHVLLCRDWNKSQINVQIYKLFLYMLQY